MPHPSWVVDCTLTLGLSKVLYCSIAYVQCRVVVGVVAVSACQTVEPCVVAVPHVHVPTMVALLARVCRVDHHCPDAALRGSWLHGLNHQDSDCDLLVVGASVDDKVRAVNVHAGGVDALCVTAGRFARLLAGADQVCVEARDYGGVLWRDGAVGRALVESVRVPLPLLVAHYRGQAARDRAALASGRGDVGRLVKLARNVVRQEACADSLTERGVLPVVSWPLVLDGVRALVDGGVVGAGVLAGVECMAGAFQ